MSSLQRPHIVGGYGPTGDPWVLDKFLGGEGCCKGTTCPVIPTLSDNPSDPSSALPHSSLTSTTLANDVRTRTDAPRTLRAPSRTLKVLRRPSRTFADLRGRSMSLRS